MEQNLCAENELKGRESAPADPLARELNRTKRDAALHLYVILALYGYKLL